jgi:hypothetical protein
LLGEGKSDPLALFLPYSLERKNNLSELDLPEPPQTPQKKKYQEKKITPLKWPQQFQNQHNSQAKAKTQHAIG